LGLALASSTGLDATPTFRDCLGGRERGGDADVLERRRALEHRCVGDHSLQALSILVGGGDRNGIPPDLSVMIRDG
jgi:hypothetical protein